MPSMLPLILLTQLYEKIRISGVMYVSQAAAAREKVDLGKSGFWGTSRG
jgi:hypothetical protein